jgi:hypothetical protein
MGHQIIKQPDGRLAIFSSVVDDWIITDATQAELEDYYAEKAAEGARKKAHEICEAVLSGNARKMYYQFTMTFKEACAQVRDHGDDGEG